VSSVWCLDPLRPAISIVSTSRISSFECKQTLVREPNSSPSPEIPLSPLSPPSSLGPFPLLVFRASRSVSSFSHRACCLASSARVSASSSWVLLREASSDVWRIYGTESWMKHNVETKINSKHTLNRVNSSNIRLFFVARSTSRLLPCCAFALSAFGSGRCTPSSSSSGLDQSSSGSRPANSTYYHGVNTMRMTQEGNAHLQNLQFSLHLVVICVCF
jgi:hypothetical protein